ncbi:MAG: hypothetical protein MUF36_07495 [Bacteroidales bacterium]|jgi:hypothetical protein|nr:hypothetical protein [Bacteroidales bacterium]
MKITRYIACLFVSALISITFTSCEKEKPLSELIIGKWEVKTERQIFTLQNDPKYEYLFYYEANELAFEFTTGGGIIIYQNGEVFSILTFTLSGNTMTVKNGNTNMLWKNISVDGNTLSWSEFSTTTHETITYDVEVVYTTEKTN